MAAFKGDGWSARRFAAAAERVRANFVPRFLDPARRVIVDGVENGSASTQVSEHANAAAIAFGCLDKALARDIVEKLFVQRTIAATEAQPFFMVVVLEALRKTGHVRLALGLIRERWGRMLAKGQTTCSEEWYSNGSWRNGAWAGFMRTLSHAWSSCPAEFLLKQLPGIESLEPGCRRLRVRPCATDFAYRCVFPVPQGEVRVTWDGQTAKVEAPDGVQIEA